MVDTILDYFGQLERIRDPNAIVDAFRKEIGRFGFSHVVAKEIDETQPNGLYEYANFWPETVNKHCMRLAKRNSHPFVLGASTSALPFTTAELQRHFSWDDDQIDYFDLLKSFGLQNGVTVPIHSPDGFAGLVTVAGSMDEPDETVTSAIQTISYYTIEQLRKLRNQACADNKLLTNRERECLSLAAIGKTDWEVGEILSISGNTVHTHIENAKRKLKTTTRVHAVVTAIQQGLITV